MDRDKAKTLLPLITAFAAGVEIEMKMADGSWLRNCSPDWSLSADQYRIKQVYRPFANAEEFKPYCDRWIRKADHALCMRVGWFTDEVICTIVGTRVKFTDFVNWYTFDDGTPCGVLVDDATPTT